MLSTLVFRHFNLSRALALSTSCDDINSCRTLVDIIWSRLSTIIAATWVSVHPNIPDPGQTRLVRVLRRLAMMFVAFLAPELVVYFAARQLSVARHFARRFHVSVTHGFFFSMGGFVSGEGHPITTIRQLQDPILGAAYISDIQHVQREDIMDKSKNDQVAKGIAFLQCLWFVLQILARAGQRLPISEIEVTTMAFAAVNLFSWILWWEKPLAVDRPISIGPPAPAAAPLLGSPPPTTRATVSPAIARLRRHYLLSETFFRGPVQGDYANYDPRQSTAVPEFWAAPASDSFPRSSAFAAMFVGNIFGAIHLAAWGAAFPSRAEQLLWRACAVFVAAYPAALAAIHGAMELLVHAHDAHAHVPFVVQVGGVGLYVLARVALTALAATTLRTMDPGWFEDVDWTKHIGHIL
ncbi:hypothetical protein GGX14DRAFT_588828 [Mycena pura]|uniref:Integral membrane protein n=1 Tax=Mycena pura TaxID=153505 RepID=A0AAD6URZ0_9AGAR|nr:hypothetical protein GGX14DRAFT_588828 [Mycena pura]